MSTTTAARLPSLAAVVVLLLLPAGTALAHPEGLTPYRYVVPPPGVQSEGAAESGVSTQPIGPPAFAGTTDNQMQLTLPEGALPARSGDQGVRIALAQLDPATLPPLPGGQEAEGNGYRVEMSFSSSGAPVDRLAAPASLGLSAPAAPTQVYELVDGAWVPVTYTPVVVEEGFTSVLTIDGPGVFLQGYSPTASAPPGPSAPASAARPEPVAESRVTPADTEAVPASAQRADSGEELRAPVVAAGVALAGLAIVLAVVVRRRRTATPSRD